MAYHHVIAKIGSEEKLRILFSDLSVEELSERFIKPYEKDTSFFSENCLISPKELQSVQIVRTERPDAMERDEINRKDLESIDRFNDSSSDVHFVSIGGGYQPQDISEVGEDLTHSFIHGPPGFRARRWEPPLKAVGWVAGIIATVAAAGIVKWLGWL